MTTHIMCDIETLGVRPGSVVMSAAFVRFSDYASCSLTMNIHDQIALGLEVNPETHAWWATQPPEAWTAATANPTAPTTALAYFATWLEWAAPDGALIWCHGASFDAPLLGEVYRRAGVAVPWAYNAIRDTRTLFDLAGVDLRQFNHGTAHVALDDAIAQTKAANEALRILARAHEPQRRFFYHAESDSLFFTDTGMADTGPGVEEIAAGEYIRRTGTVALAAAA